MRQQFRNAFTLVELLVVIAIIGTLVGLLLPAVQSARETSRRNHCSTNLVQLAKAMQMYEDTNGKYPGYINALGIPHGQTTRAPWLVFMFPYIEQNVLWDRWREGEYNVFQYIETILCPSNPPAGEDDGPFAYVANCGEWQDRDQDGTVREIPANGMFFNHSRYADYPKPMLGTDSMDELDTEDEPDLDAPIVNMSLAYIQSRGDGSTRTLMLTESIRTVRYGYVGIPSGLPDEYDMTADAKYHFGFTWAQPIKTIGIDRDPNWQEMRVNGQTDTAEYGLLKQMTPYDGFPSSHHGAGVNVAWAAGQVTFLNENVDQLVYSQLMTTSHKGSTLADPTGQILERELPQPGDGDY